MRKSEVYSWRLSPRLKSDLEVAARARRQSLAELLEQIARAWLREVPEREGSDEERQQRLHAAAMEWVGTIQGDDPHRAERASAEVRARLSRRYGRHGERRQ